MCNINAHYTLIGGLYICLYYEIRALRTEVVSLLFSGSSTGFGAGTQ